MNGNIEIISQALSESGFTSSEFAVESENETGLEEVVEVAEKNFAGKIMGIGWGRRKKSLERRRRGSGG